MQKNIFFNYSIESFIFLSLLFGSGNIHAERQTPDHQEFTVIINDDQSERIQETGSLKSQQAEAQNYPDIDENIVVATADMSNNEIVAPAVSNDALFSYYGAKAHNGNLVVYSHLFAGKNDWSDDGAGKILELTLFNSEPDLLGDTWWTSKLVKHLSELKQQQYISGNTFGGNSYSWVKGGWRGENEFVFNETYQRFINKEVSGILSRAPKLPLRVVRMAVFSLENYNLQKQQFEINRFRPHFEGTGSALLPKIQGVDETMLDFELAKTLPYPADKARELLDGKRSIILYEVITTDLIRVNRRKSERSQSDQLSFVAKPVSSEIYYDKKLTKKFRDSDIKVLTAWQDEQLQVKQTEDTPLPLNWETVFLLMLRDYPESVQHELFNAWAVRRANIERRWWEASDTWSQLDRWQPFFSATSARRINLRDVLDDNTVEDYKKWSILRAKSLGEEVSVHFQYWNERNPEPDRIPLGEIVRIGQFSEFFDTSKTSLSINEIQLGSRETDAVVKTLGDGLIVHGTRFSRENHRKGAIVFRDIRADQEIVINNHEKDNTFELISRIGKTVLNEYNDSPLRELFIVPLEPVRLIVRNNQGEIVQTINFEEMKKAMEKKRAELVANYPKRQLDILGVKIGMSAEEARNIVAEKGLEISNNKSKRHSGNCGSKKDKVDTEVEEEKAAKTVDNTEVDSLRIKKLQQLPATCSEDLYDIFKLAFVGNKKYRRGLEDSVLVYVSEPKFGGKVVAIARKFIDTEKSVDFLAKIITLHGEGMHIGHDKIASRHTDFWFESGEAYYKVKDDKSFAKQCVTDRQVWPISGVPGMNDFLDRGFKVNCGKYMGYTLIHEGNHSLFLIDTSYVMKVRSASKSLYEKRKKIEDEVPF